MSKVRRPGSTSTSTTSSSGGSHEPCATRGRAPSRRSVLVPAVACYGRAVRALIYDRTCVWRGGALSHAWAAGSRLYRALGRIDAARGVASWDEALGWLAELRAPIDEVQYWGHGKWG